MKLFVLLTLFLTLLLACNEEKIEIPDTGRKIVINGLITTDSFLNASITESAFLTNNNFDYQNSPVDAKVSIYQNNIFLDSLLFLQADVYQSFIMNSNYWSKSVVPIAGEKYKIVAELPGFPEASASITIPDEVKIEHVDTSRTMLDLPPEWPSKVRMIFNIEFTDPANETNYYLLFVSKKGNNVGRPDESIGFNSQDPVVEENLNDAGDTGVQGIAFSDRIINGEKYSLTVSIDGSYIGWPFYDDFYTVDGIPVPYHKKVINFKLYSISAEYFKYIQTLNLYRKNIGNPLADPVQVNSNVIGGYGIFTGAAVSSDSIVFGY